MSICLMRLVLNNKDRFHPQDWYWDEDFAWDEESDTAAWVNICLIKPGLWDMMKMQFRWMKDVDNRGDRVYVGGWGLGKGFQIHRHLTIKPEMFINSLDK